MRVTIQKKEKGDDKEGNKDDDVFPAVHDCYMIYGGPSTQLTARQRKRERREVFAARMAVPQYLSWSSTPITFDREDHPDKVIAPGVYPLVVDPIIINTWLSKVLMDGDSSLNIIYLETLNLLGIDRGRLQPSAGGFHGVVPGKKALPVGRIDLPVCFGTAANFRKETLTFEVVGFRGTYHAIIGRPGYAKFMAIPNYTYLKLKMPGPKASSLSAPPLSTLTSATSSASSMGRRSRTPPSSSQSSRPWPPRLQSPSATRVASSQQKEPRRSRLTLTTPTVRC